MATIYVRSTDGSNADNGTTWALAKATITGAAAIDADGDTIWLSQAHSESTAGAVAPGFAGSVGSPVRILCGDDSAEPPTALATTAVVASTGANHITLGGSNARYLYFYGIIFSSGDGINTKGSNVFDSCKFRLSAASNTIILNNDTGAPTLFRDCSFKFAATGQGFVGGPSVVRGGSIESGGTTPTALFKANSEGRGIVFDGFDMSALGSAVNMVSSIVGNLEVTWRDCRLPASWSGSLHSGTPGAACVLQMFNCDSADTHYRYRKATARGTIVDETTLVRTGGANDGTTTYSFKLVTNTSAIFPAYSLDTPEMVKWNDTTGSAITTTVEILRDSATNLKDNEIWIDVMYLGTSGVPLASFINDGISVVATAADQAASSTTWTTTGMANPNKQKLSVTFTPQEAGFIHVTVKLAKASTTVYIDPMITVT